ncbi:Chloroperoxidase [Aspergillus unguis]
MKIPTLAAAAAILGSATAFPQYMDIEKTQQSWQPREWKAPGPDDSRGPCPGLNTLANHGYLPRDGRNITLDKLKDGMLEGFNIAHSDADLLFFQAVRTSPELFSDHFDLANLGRHGILEHDISLSRSDAYFANPRPFNETVWAETMSYFTTPMITVKQLAEARMGRLATSKKTNPEFSLSWLADGFSWGECASFFEIMADGTTGTVNRTYIDYWFRHERMPTEIGWQRRNTTMPSSERQKYSELLAEAAGVKKRDLTTDAYGRPLNA